MNFRTVMIIRNGLRRGESGQAFAELTVSLIAILAVFVGFLLIAAVCSDRVTTLITARAKADEKSSSGWFSEGESIQRWDYGADGIPYTTDDNAVPGSGGKGSIFTDQLAYNDRNDVSLQHPPSSVSHLRGEFTMLQDNNVFVNAASLASGKGQVPDSIQNHYSDSDASALKSAAGWLFGIGSTRIEDKVYMPAHKDPANDRDD